MHLHYEEPEEGSYGGLLLATTVYDKADTAYTHSIARAVDALKKHGHSVGYLILEGNCHVDDARNTVVRHFRRGPWHELMFLDADVCFEPDAIIKLAGHHREIVGAVYPFRGGARENMPMRLMDTRFPDEDGMLELDGLPTGFLKIQREVFDKLEPHVPWYWDKTEKTPQFFGRAIHQDNQRWGGDIEFCKKWRDLGGKIFADTEIRLGHAAKVVYRDSLAAFLRRNCGITLSYILPMIRDGVEVITDYDEISAYADLFASEAGTLALLAGLSRQSRGPIVETGSGISSVVMAIANSGNQVYSLENDSFYLKRTQSLADSHDVKNLNILECPILGEWYDIAAAKSQGLPDGKFAIGYCDGPPRLTGSRVPFLEHIAPRCKIIVMDDVGTDWKFAKVITDWCDANGKSLEMMGRAGLIR